MHSETGQAPLERFLAAGPAAGAAGGAALREAFRWSEKRTVSKTGTFGMHGNTYEVDAELAGQRGRAGVRPARADRDRGARSTVVDGRAGGPVDDQPSRPPTRAAGPPPSGPPTGIDYLGLIAASAASRSLQQRIDYRNLPARRRRERQDDSKEQTG